MILQSATLQGKISACGGLRGVLSKPVGYVDYNGDYEVLPMVEAQMLHTKDKHMTDDVIIKAIPYFNVGNNAGGTTVYIGSEV